VCEEFVTVEEFRYFSNSSAKVLVRVCMLPNIVLHIGWIVHHSREHGYSWYDAAVYNRGCSRSARVDEASLRLEHVEADEQICFTVGYDCRYLGCVLGLVYVGG